MNNISNFFKNRNYTGRQKELFARSKIKKQTFHNHKLQQLEEKQIQHDAACPYQCGECENHMHFLECRFTRASEKRRELMKISKQTLEGKQVHDAIIILLLWGLQWHKTKETPTCQLLQGPINSTLQQAIDKQTLIG